MKVTVILFGQLADIAGMGQLDMEDTPDTGSLVSRMNGLYPALAGSRYILAVNKQLVTENTLLQDDAIVALLPPFSGG